MKTLKLSILALIFLCTLTFIPTQAATANARYNVFNQVILHKNQVAYVHMYGSKTQSGYQHFFNRNCQDNKCSSGDVRKTLEVRVFSKGLNAERGYSAWQTVNLDTWANIGGPSVPGNGLYPDSQVQIEIRNKQKEGKDFYFWGTWIADNDLYNSFIK